MRYAGRPGGLEAIKLSGFPSVKDIYVLGGQEARKQ
jgi:hypothetical protein